MTQFKNNPKLESLDYGNQNLLQNLNNFKYKSRKKLKTHFVFHAIHSRASAQILGIQLNFVCASYRGCCVTGRFGRNFYPISVAYICLSF